MGLNKSFVGGLLSGVGVTIVFEGIAIVVLVLLLRPGEKGDCSIVSRLPSADKKHTIVEYTDMGGGVLGWCRQVIDVADNRHVFNADSSYSNFLYECSFGCDTKLNASWVNDSTVLVEYTVDRKHGSRCIIQKTVNDDGTVAIEYRIRK